MLTPTYKPGDRVITATRGHGIVWRVFGATLYVNTPSGVVATSAHVVRRDAR